jgi:oligopeptide transport system ATP-binding protein
MELLNVKSLKKYFHTKKGFGSAHLLLKAVDGIDFSVDSDEIFALVGESGCGKSTVAKIALRLLEPTSGNVFFEGKDVFALEGDFLRAFRKSVQIIFQDPFASLNPRRTVFDAIAEPLRIHNIVKKHELENKCVELLEKVGLRSDALKRYPHEFSGGQRQRICIARALSVEPRLIVADEPLSALDVSIQAQIINLLQELKRESGIAFLFISHDLRVVHYFSDTIAVMYLGKIIECAKTPELFDMPMHPYTVMLLASAPKTECVPMKKDVPKGEAPSLLNMPKGCPFHPRCQKRFDLCDKTVPELKKNNGRLVACHLWK